MNLKNLFNNRNKNFARLNEAGDYLGRRLRENLVIYDIDDSNNRVTYVTESSNLISCHYKETNSKLTLENFNIAGLGEIMSDDAVDSQVKGNIHEFVTGLVNDRYDKAESSFDAIVESFTMRAKIEESRKKLNKKIARFGDAYNITETKSFSKFEEISPMLEKFLKENIDKVKRIGRLSDVEFVDDIPNGTIQFNIVPHSFALDLKGLVDIDKELDRLNKELNKLSIELLNVEKKLSNQKFIQNAPAEIIKKQKNILVELQIEQSKITSSKDKLLNLKDN